MNGTTNRNSSRANASLIDQLVQKRSGATVLTTTKQFDKLNRLSGISSVSSVPSVVNSAAYAFNGANQRTRLTEADGKFWDFGYDTLGQVTSGVKKLTDSTPVLGHSFGYSFDTIGNLKTTAVNGQSATYTPDAAGLNQYDNRTVPAALDIIGTADAGAKVAVNLAPALRQGDLFYKQLPVTNTSAAKWQAIDILAGKAGAGIGGADADTRQSGHLFLAKTPENFADDFDGNLTSDSQWSYVWDAENRLVSMETQPSAVTAGVPRQKLEFTYDAVGRRVQKKVSNWNGTGYIVASATRFLYDGWNLLAELNGLASNAVTRSYVWGLDLSGSTEGAGGVGGLLAVNVGSASYLPIYDGNGNILGLVNSSTGTLDAKYEYGPFGEPLRLTGPAAATNPFVFSTKYTDSENGMLYYGFRYYNTSTGRWLSRDPIEEMGGVNLYSFLANEPLSQIDDRGNSPVSAKEKEGARADLKFDGFSTNEIATLTMAHRASIEYADEAISHLGGMTKANTSERFKKWFGCPDSERLAKVRNIYQKVSSRLQEKSIKFRFDGSDTVNSAYVRWSFAGVKIMICPGFWSLTMMGKDSKAGVLVHEMTHKVGGTADHVYGKNSSLSLAKSNPDEAVDNADNYEYFVELR